MAVDANGVEIPEVAVPAVVIPDVVVPPVLPVAPVVEPPKPTGSAYFDNVLNVLHDKGLPYEQLMQEYTNNGAVSPENRAAMVAALGEPQVKLIELGVAEEKTKITTAQQVETQRVFSAIALPGFTDGKAAWDTLAEWSKANVSIEERGTLNEMLSKGGVQADLAVKALKDKYMADPSYTVPATLITGDGLPPAGGPEPISRSTYTLERRKAENARDKVAIASLDARAKHTMQHNQAAWRP